MKRSIHVPGRIVWLAMFFGLAAGVFSAGAATLNEWLFDLDVPGLPLSSAINSGTDGAVFSADTIPVTQTDGDRSLICRNDVDDTANLWTNGAVLVADVTSQTAGSRFLRYDVDYDLSATNSNTGTLLALGFSDETQTNLASFFLANFTGQSSNEDAPAGIGYTPIQTGLDPTGRVSVIAQVNLNSQEMHAWYDLSGENSFNASNNPNASVDINLSSIDKLQFRATGDCLPGDTGEALTVDNIRTAATWSEITEPIVALSESSGLSVSLRNSLGSVMLAGQTNVVTVTVTNSGDPATFVNTDLAHDGGSGLSISSSTNNAPFSLGTNQSDDQTYEVVANTDGLYVLTAQASSAETNSTPETSMLQVGPPTFLNDWAFYLDDPGLGLSWAANSGIDGAVFSADADGIATTDGMGSLVCRNNAPASVNVWADGPVATADVTNQTGGVRFLRYDFDYNLTGADSNTGTLLSLGFSDATHTNLASIVFSRAYDLAPAGINYVSIENNLNPAGRISVIAQVDLSNQRMHAWYNLSGENSFNAANTPNASVDINLGSIEELQFRVAGDCIPGSFGEALAIDNIRTADTWEKITAPFRYETAVPTIQSVEAASDAMTVGETNTISVVIRNERNFAERVTSSLTFDALPGDFTVVESNNTPVAANENQLVTNTYTFVAHTDGLFEYVVTANSDGTLSLPETRDLVVGGAVVYSSYAVANDGPGIHTNMVEPGDTFDLVISSINNGTETVTGVTNSVTFDNASYFRMLSTVTPSVYPSVDPGETVMTTYRVKCSENTPDGLQSFTVINRSAANVWTDSDRLDVLARAAASVTPSNVTMNVLAGERNTGTVLLSNVGNQSGEFSILIPDSSEVAHYSAAETTAEGLYDAFGPWSLFDNWNGTDTDSINLKFNFSPFGTAYSSFSVSQFGTITLSGNDGDATLRPFEMETTVDPSTIRYEQTTTRLIVAWGRGTGREFQVWINPNGTVLYLYQYGTWGTGTIGAQINGKDQLFTHTPGLRGRDGLLLTTASWLTASPSGGTIDAGESKALTFTASSSSGQAAGSYTVPVTVTLGSTSVEMDVTVVVVSVNPDNPVTAILDVSMDPNPLTFSGPAGVRTRAAMVISNTGNAAVSYKLRDSGLESAGYTVITNQSDFGSPGVYTLRGRDLDTRPISIGFPFTFFGSVYTNLIVGLDGTLSLGTEKIIPFSAALSTNSSSSIRYSTNLQKTEFTVSWNQMIQPDGEGKQTFHAVLCRETGEILFYYDQLLGNWTNGVIQLAGDASTVTGSLINDETVLVETNITEELITEEDPDIPGWYTVVGTNYTTHVVTTVYDANRQSLRFVPGEPRIVAVSPMSGELPVGGRAELIVTGDATGLTAGGTNQVAYDTTFNAYLEALNLSQTETITSVANVTFTATNSEQTAYASPRVQTAMWGTDNPVVSSTINVDGSRMLSWPVATGDDLSRTYTVWYTTRLNGDWTLADTVKNKTTYLDEDPVRRNEPVMFYRVTVE